MNERETFINRWARRKAALNEVGVQPQKEELAAADGSAESEFDKVDFSALDFNSDFTCFMGEKVPDSIRNRALQMLWASSDIIGKPDDLDDFLEDFSEGAMALPPALAKSAYKIGAGFVTANATSTDRDSATAAERTCQQTAADSASPAEQTQEDSSTDSQAIMRCSESGVPDK